MLLLASFTGITIWGLYESNNEPPQRIKNLEAKKGRIQIVNLGTSHGGDFDYTNCELVPMYFNNAGNTLYYDLHNYLYLLEGNYLAPRAIVLIPVSYFVFGLDENRLDGHLDAPFVNRYYQYLPAKHIYDYSLSKDLELKTARVQANFFGLLGTEQPQSEIPEPQGRDEEFMKNWPKSQGKEAELIYHAKHRSRRHKELALAQNPDKGISYLNRLVESVKEAEHVPVLITPPYFEAYSKGFGENWLDSNYFSVMRSIALDQNVRYSNYSHHDAFLHQADLFKDSDHLNDKGRTLFSEMLFDELKEEFEWAKQASSEPVSLH